MKNDGYVATRPSLTHRSVCPEFRDGHGYAAGTCIGLRRTGTFAVHRRVATASSEDSTCQCHPGRAKAKSPGTEDVYEA